MKPKILLRIASILMLLHTAGHTMGALTWSDAPNAAVAQVVKGMETVHFAFMGQAGNVGSFFQRLRLYKYRRIITNQCFIMAAFRGRSEQIVWRVYRIVRCVFAGDGNFGIRLLFCVCGSNFGTCRGMYAGCANFEKQSQQQNIVETRSFASLRRFIN